MTHAFELSKDNGDQPDYEIRLALLEDDFPHAQLTHKTRRFLLDGLTEMYQRNGNRPYHDGLHPLDVMRGAFSEAEDRASILEVELTRRDYEAMAIAGAYHDIIMDAEGDDTPEMRSATYAKEMMRRLDYPEAQIDRVHTMILATTAQYVGDKVLHPLAASGPRDFCVPSLIHGDTGDSLHAHWMRILLTAGKVAAEELYKLKVGDDPLKKVMGIFDKQRTFSNQQFEDWPDIIRHHCGEAEAEIYLRAKKEELTNQKNFMATDYLERLDKIRDNLASACLSIIENTTMSYREKGDAFFRAAMALLGKKPE